MKKLLLLTVACILSLTSISQEISKDDPVIYSNLLITTNDKQVSNSACVTTLYNRGPIFVITSNCNDYYNRLELSMLKFFNDVKEDKVYVKTLSQSGIVYWMLFDLSMSNLYISSEDDNISYLYYNNL